MKKRGKAVLNKEYKIGKINKKGQIMGMPFIFIFSLILIAVALFVGIWAIKNFLNQAELMNILDFASGRGTLQNEVYNIWQKEEATKTITFDFSTKFNLVCFINQSNGCNSISDSIIRTACSESLYRARTDMDNLFLCPEGTAEKYGSNTAWHIKCGTKECLDISQTKCFPVKNGKVTITLKKEGGKLVTVS